MSGKIYVTPLVLIIGNDESPILPGTKIISNGDSDEATDDEGGFAKETDDGLTYDESWGVSWE